MPSRGRRRRHIRRSTVISVQPRVTSSWVSPLYLFDYGEVTRMADGATVREFALTAAEDTTLEGAPGLSFPVWSDSGQVSGPTLRANEGELLRVHFTNARTVKHTSHFQGSHNAFHDGAGEIGRSDVMPGERHLYHCHSFPLPHHIQEGLYGAFILT